MIIFVTNMLSCPKQLSVECFWLIYLESNEMEILITNINCAFSRPAKPTLGK